jgi:hypothetical protein
MHGHLLRWVCRDQRDRQTLREWTLSQVGEQREKEFLAAKRHRGKKISHSEMFARLASRRGDIEPLRRLHPEYVDSLQPPKRGRGKYERRERPWAIQQAMRDVKLIHAIWRKRFDGKWKRRGDSLDTEIAAERWLVDEHELRRALGLK